MSEKLSAQILEALQAPTTSVWLRDALISSCLRDPIEAAHDAETLADLVGGWADHQLNDELSGIYAIELQYVPDYRVD